MSRPARYGGKSHSHSQTTPAERNAPGSGDGAAASASALNKAHAQYNEPLIQLQAIFPDWKDDDLLSILEDTRGDVETAVARISEGHAEQWGDVKHKRDKKLPVARERERDRDGHAHSSPRGANSPRGRGRGSRGGNFRSGTPREHRDRNANGVTSTPSAGWGTEPVANGTGHEPVLDTAQSTSWATSTDATADGWDTETAPAAKDDSLESHPPPVEEAKPTSIPVATSTSSKPRKIPASSGMSWAQIAKPQPKLSAPPKSATAALELPTHQQEPEPTSVVTENGWEEPTTVQPPTWDEEPASSEPPIVESAPSDDWVNIPTPTAETEMESSSQPPAEPLQEEHQEPLVALDPVPVPPARQEAPETIAPPPGLANPAASQAPTTLKPSTPSNVRPSYAARLSSRWKTDQPVVLPPTAGFAKSLPLQFGSLNILDDNETQNNEMTAQDSQSIEQKPAISSLAPHPVEAPQAIPSSSPANSFRAQTQPEAPVASPDANMPPGISHPQPTSVNQPLAIASASSPAFPPHQQIQPQSQPVVSQHTLAGLAHVPQHPSQQTALGHSHQQSFGQPNSFPQHQQQFESGGIGISGAPLSNLTQQTQSQNQAFFRQTESPFYNQTQSQVPDHGFSSGTGGFGQGAQSGFNGGPALVNDFGYEGQRNPYDSYGSQGSFSSRAALRQDEAKGLGGASGAGLGMHHGQTPSSQLGGNQTTGSQGQGQYTGMAHIANPFYYNINPYGYGNQFYSPAFPSFVNPMYQAGGNQTPPHNSKPGNMAGTGGLGVSGNGPYSSSNPGHIHHSSAGFDSDAGPGGTPTYHQPSPGLAGDFSKGVYAGGQGFLGNMGTSSGPNRGPGGGAASVGQTPTSESSFKGYGAATGAQSGLGGADKPTAAQGARGASNVSQGQQQFYQNTRFPAGQNQGYPQQQAQGDSYYYQRW